MNGQELVDELRAFIPGVSDMGTLSRAADRIEALEAELAEKREIISRTWLDDYSTLQVEIVRAKHRAERAEQECAELAAVIAEALAIHKPHQVATSGSTIPELPNSFEQRCNWCDTPWPCRTARALSAAPADVLSAYTTRIREEAWEQAAQISEAVAVDWAMTYKQFAADKITKAIRALSAIPEGQNDNE